MIAGLFLSLLAAIVIFGIMMVIQGRKEKEADEKYEFTMKLIEMRNRKHGDSDEST